MFMFLNPSTIRGPLHLTLASGFAPCTLHSTLTVSPTLSLTPSSTSVLPACPYTRGPGCVSLCVPPSTTAISTLALLPTLSSITFLSLLSSSPSCITQVQFPLCSLPTAETTTEQVLASDLSFTPCIPLQTSPDFPAIAQVFPPLGPSH